MTTPPAITVCGDTLARIFPFHLALDASLNIIQCGSSLAKVCPGVVLGSEFPKLFRVRSPRLKPKFTGFLEKQHLLIVVEHLESGMTLRGQVVPADQENCLLFLCSPWLVESSSLKQAGLNINDFALHDPVVDLLQVIQASRVALEDSKKLSRRLKEKQQELTRAKDVAAAANRTKSQKNRKNRRSDQPLILALFSIAAFAAFTLRSRFALSAAPFALRLTALRDCGCVPLFPRLWVCPTIPTIPCPLFLSVPLFRSKLENLADHADHPASLRSMQTEYDEAPGMTST